jgi:hypothetical protein
MYRSKQQSKNRGGAHEGREGEIGVEPRSKKKDTEHRLETKGIARMACVQVHIAMRITS